MKKHLTLMSLFLMSIWQGTNAQVTSLNVGDANIPGIGCYTNVLACLNYGTQAESGAQIIIDWSDGNSDTMMAYGAPNTQTCYGFNHNYSLPGNYVAVATVTSGTLNGELVATTPFNCLIPTTTACGFFNIISMLNPSSVFLTNVPYDITNSSGTTTIYPIDSYGNPYYTQLNESDAPFQVSINDDWLTNNGYVQTSPDFTISSFDVTGRAENVPMNMQLECTGNGQTPNLAITLAAAFQFVAPLETGNVTVQVCNVSCGNSANSILKVAIPAGVTPILTTVPNAVFANDTVTLSIANLNGCTSLSFPCQFAGTTPAGTLFPFYAVALAENETDLMFNSQSFTATVLNSYDPNDKQSDLPPFINPDVKEKLVYTVRFQNDGNYAALNVTVRDTISPLLDLSTFRFINSKHPVSYSIDPGTREVVFKFNGIDLLPSGENLEGSQGMFTYSIEELDNLALNSEILNTAYIYFDFNPAIITNTTSNKNTYLGVNTSDLAEIIVFPNPASDAFTLNITESGSLKIYNLSGSLVFDKMIVPNQKIDVSHLSKGFYHLQVSTPNGTVLKKLTIE